MAIPLLLCVRYGGRVADTIKVFASMLVVPGSTAAMIVASSRKHDKRQGVCMLEDVTGKVSIRDILDRGPMYGHH